MAKWSDIAKVLVVSIAFLGLIIWAMFYTGKLPIIRESEIEWEDPPGFRFDDVPYSPVHEGGQNVVPEDIELIATVAELVDAGRIEKYDYNQTNVGVYTSSTRPGWVYVEDEDTQYRKYVVWSLQHPMVRYNGKIYILTSGITYDRVTDYRWEETIVPYTKDFQAAGELHFTSAYEQPSEELGTNAAQYDGATIYVNNEDLSTVYVKRQKGGKNTAFHDMSLIPIKQAANLN